MMSILSEEDLRLLLDLLAQETVSEPTEKFPYKITVQGHGYSKDRKIAGLQVKLSMLLELQGKRPSKTQEEHCKSESTMPERITVPLCPDHPDSEPTRVKYRHGSGYKWVCAMDARILGDAPTPTEKELEEMPR